MIGINLLNPESRRHPLRCKSFGVGITLVTFALATAGLFSWRHFLQRRIEDNQPLALQVKKARIALDRIKGRIDSNQEKHRVFTNKVASLQIMQLSRCAPINVLETATRCLPVNQTLSLTSLIHAEGRVHFRGSSLDFGEMVNFLRCLDGSTIFSSAKLVRWNRRLDTFDFEILCILEG